MKAVRRFLDKILCVELIEPSTFLLIIFPVLIQADNLQLQL